MLTEKTKNDIANMVMDLETGNHLLRQRDDEYRKFGLYMSCVLVIGPRNAVEQELVDYFKACQDPEEMEKFNEKYK